MLRGNDELKDWVRDDVPDECWHSTNVQDVVDEYARLMVWVNSAAQYKPAAKAKFARSADAWLIAFCLVREFTLVTHEVHAPQAQRNVPIPNVCVAFDVAYVDTFDMLRDLDVSFDWHSPA